MKPSFANDDEALHALIQNRQEAVKYFFSNYYRHLLLFITPIIGNNEEAEDLASQTFLRLWQKRGSLSTQGSIRSWLLTTAKNLAIDQLRKNTSAQKKLTAYQQHQSLHLYTNLNLEHHLIEAQSFDAILKAAASLPPKTFQVFKAHYLENKSLTQIAEDHATSPNTVRNQRTRIIQLLKEKLHK